MLLLQVQGTSGDLDTLGTGQLVGCHTFSATYLVVNHLLFMDVYGKLIEFRKIESSLLPSLGPKGFRLHFALAWVPIACGPDSRLVCGKLKSRKVHKKSKRYFSTYHLPVPVRIGSQQCWAAIFY